MNLLVGYISGVVLGRLRTGQYWGGGTGVGGCLVLLGRGNSLVCLNGDCGELVVVLGVKCGWKRVRLDVVLVVFDGIVLL